MRDIQPFPAGRVPSGVHVRPRDGRRALAPQHSGAGTRKPDVFERVTQTQPTPDELSAYAGSYTSEEIETESVCPVHRRTSTP
jgi:hypothetical protein